MQKFNVKNLESDHFGIYTLNKPLILDQSKFKAFTDNNINVARVTEFVFGLKTQWEKEKMWSPAFSPIPIMFSKVFFISAIKSGKELMYLGVLYS